MKAYRGRLDTIRSTLTPVPVEADRWSVPDRHERWGLEWNDRRLAVLDRDVDAIIRTHARDRKAAAWLHDTAKAFEEIGEIDLAIDWARQAADHHPDHQALQAADYWCELLARHRPTELVITRHLVFSRWPSATTAARLHRDAGSSWPDYRDEVLNALAARPDQAVLFALHTLNDPRFAWEQAAAVREDDDHTWAEVAKAYEPIDPLAVLPIHRRLVEHELVNAGGPALPACGPTPRQDAQTRCRHRPSRRRRHVHHQAARHAPAAPTTAAGVRPRTIALNPAPDALPERGYDDGVAKTADDLRTEVLALPAQDRARIATELLASLDSEAVDEDEIDELWSVETKQRAAMLDTGEAGTLSWGEIEQRFAERRAQRDA